MDAVHPRILIRRLLGRRGVFLVRNILSSLVYWSGVVNLVDNPRAFSRDDCISAVVCTYNDPDWIEPSLLSIRDLVKEYVVIDSSTDETPDIILDLKSRYDLNIIYERTPPGDLVTARNKALKLSRCRWILHWDADFIARPELIVTLREILASLDRRRHYLLYWPHITFCGDLKHLCGDKSKGKIWFHIEHWLFTWSPRLKYDWVGRYDSLIAPIYLYKAIYIDKPLSIHLTSVRNPKRYALKMIWWKYREEFNRAAREGIDPETLARRKAVEEFGTDDLEKIGYMLIKKSVENLPEYDPKIYGELPQILVDYMRKKRMGQKPSSWRSIIIP